MKLCTVASVSSKDERRDFLFLMFKKNNECPVVVI